MKKLTAISLVLMLFCSFSTSAFSWDHYRYRDGHYFRDAGWWGFGGLVTGLAVGAYVASLPPRYETIVINGTPYYYSDGYYYQAGSSGYVVVDPPAGQQSPAPAPAGSDPGNPMMYILEVLAAILLIAGIGLLIKKLLTNERKMA